MGKIMYYICRYLVTILVNGFFIELNQGMTTAGSCRYKQAIPVGFGGRLDKNSNYGIKKAFLSQVL
jgi:hypothetical protein